MGTIAAVAKGEGLDACGWKVGAEAELNKWQAKSTALQEGLRQHAETSLQAACAALQTLNGQVCF